MKRSVFSGWRNTELIWDRNEVPDASDVVDEGYAASNNKRSSREVMASCNAIRVDSPGEVVHVEPFGRLFANGRGGVLIGHRRLHSLGGHWVDSATGAGRSPRETGGPSLPVNSRAACDNRRRARHRDAGSTVPHESAIMFAKEQK